MFDTAIIGAGFGGLGTALELTRQGQRVFVCEAMDYPGGCAGKFTHKGQQFQAGATFVTGIPGPLKRLLDRHQVSVQTSALSPVLTWYGGQEPVPVPADWLSFSQCFDVPGWSLFCHKLKTIAAPLWDMLNTPADLPPLRLDALGRHLRRPGLLSVLGSGWRTMEGLLGACGLSRQQHPRLLGYVDALCQITVQTDASQALVPFAATAFAAFFAGPVHLEGGAGVLANQAFRRLTDLGAETRLNARCKSLRPTAGGWVLRFRDEEIRAKKVVCNMPKAAAERLLGNDPGPLPTHGWSAAMIFGQLKDPGPARHLHATLSVDKAPIHGNGVFVSVEDVGPQGTAPVTISTHMQSFPDREQAKAAADAVHEQMQRTMAERLPQLWSQMTVSFTASPRTFARYTLRPGGLVGGPARTRDVPGLRSVLMGFLRHAQPAPGVYLVGDDQFPGQSILATWAGGERLARTILTT